MRSLLFTGGNFGDEPRVAVDAPIEALAGQDADLDLDHVASVLFQLIPHRILVKCHTPPGDAARLTSFGMCSHI